jgi:hypothetical protein
MNYVTLQQAIQDYSENTEALFVANIPTFVQQAEERIFNTINFPSLRKNVTGTLTTGNQYLSLPNDWLSTYSIAIYNTGYTPVPYTYLLNKDVNFIREAYPSPTTANRGTPKYYSIFGPTYNNTNELSCILGPTPDADYNVELHYFFYPPSIVQGIITGIGSLTAGSGYTNGTYENIAVTGGSGQNATATITVAGSVVTAFTINNGGQFFVVGDTISFSASSIGVGTGSGFSTTVASVNNSTGTSWLGDNFDPVLLYGAMREAMLFMKGEQDLVKYYEDKYSEALMLAKRLGDGLERGDAYRDGQTKLNTNIKGNAAV